MVNILARILDSERNFSGSADPMITADRGFIEFLGPDFGFWLLGRSDRSDRGSSTFPRKSHFHSFMCRMSRSGENDVGYINISLIVILKAKTEYHKRQLQQMKSLWISRVI